MRILIAEDDAALAGFVRKGLESEHYAVDVSGDGEQSRAMASEFDYDLVVLDLNLPRLDGIAILRYLRTRKPTMPLLVLTGRSRVEDRVQCLDLGADDYLIKPFSFTELSARIRALLRRSHLPAESVLAVDDLKLDRVERRVERAGRRIELTSKEFALLEYLMRNAGRRITRAMIIEHVWNLSFDTCTNVVDVYIFGRWQPVEGIREAVIALGLQRMRDIATSCSVLKLMPKEQTGIDPIVFWEHSLGCALVCRQFARKIGFSDPGKAYLGGLLHDIGIVVHLWLIPDEFKKAVELAREEHIPLHEAELRSFGISHTETGKMVAEKWHMPADITEVIRAHHDPASATVNRDLVAVVSLSDLLCRMGGIGHGSVEDRQIDFVEEPGFETLLKECPTLNTFDWARFTFELEGYLEEVRRLVALMYRPA
ncbi:MAG TPA: HDOD domain-containing protein [Terriglobales bacterium]|jgi:putative nucleotidyltransferase with HDIG domain|nr:HDOD domain-containing protein [Terriglobales bacterium]